MNKSFPKKEVHFGMFIVCAFLLCSCTSAPTTSSCTKIHRLLEALFRDPPGSNRLASIQELDRYEASVILECVSKLDHTKQADSACGFCQYAPHSRHEVKFKEAVLRMTKSENELVRAWSSQALLSASYMPIEYKEALNKLKTDKSQLVRTAIKAAIESPRP